MRFQFFIILSDRIISYFSFNFFMSTRVERIKNILTQKLSPIHLDILNDSHKHAHHTAMIGNPNAGNETHLVVKIVSQDFEGMKRLERHRFIYTLLEEELNNGLHALQIDAKTPNEFQTL